MNWVKLTALLAVLASSPAVAEVKSSSASGFEVQSRVTVAASPADAYAALGRISELWDPEHSYSGSAANLLLDLRACGCFIEMLNGGGVVEHKLVVLA